jgi:hypothetical protein
MSATSEVEESRGHPADPPVRRSRAARTTAVEVVDFDRELRRAFREPAQLAADPSLGS